jgi:flagellar motility protein MotE (MotC chaperone)
VHKLISWKHSFKRLSEEYEVARKKKQALDNLLRKGRISQSTFDVFNQEIEDAIAEVEKEEKALLEKMARKVVELEDQVKTLEVLLANFEIGHVTGEIDDQTYQRQNDLLSVGLETTKQELDEVKEAADQLAIGELTLSEEVEQQPQESEDAQQEVKILEETLPTEEKAPVEHDQETVVQAVTCAEQVRPVEVKAKVEEKQ